MPNRVLRDITDSESINKLSSQAEVLFYRLMMKADDYGVFHAKPSLIKANCFPLRLDSIREADISRWLTECEKAGLIAFYDSESKPYLWIIKFGQRTRNMKKRYPSPPDNLRQVAASRGGSPPETKPESETETETGNETERLGGEKIISTPPSQAMIERMFIDSGLSESDGAEFFNEVEGRVGWATINDWFKYTLAAISKRLKQKQNGKVTGNYSNRINEQKQSVRDVKNLAIEVLRQSGGGDV